MKEAIVSPAIKVEIVDSPIPEPSDDQVLIKVVVSGSNPKDWKLPAWLGDTHDPGDDIAGEVVKVGKNVYEFKPGDRVAAFHEIRTPSGSYAEYAIAWQHTTFHIPKTISFEEAATIPLAAATAGCGLYRVLRLPPPWLPATEPTPLIIYGGATAVGAFTIQLAKRSNIHPLIVVAGKSTDFVRTLLDESKGDAIVDYRDGADAVVAGIQAAVPKGVPVKHAYDAVSEHGSQQALGRVLAANGGGLLTTVLPLPKDVALPEGVTERLTQCSPVHSDEGNGKDFGQVLFRCVAKGLADGWFKPHPHKVAAGGLAGIEGALEQLRDGKVNAFKYVFRIAETEGAGQAKL